MPNAGPAAGDKDMMREISSAIVALYAQVYGHNGATAYTFINGDVVVCVLEDTLSSSERDRVAAGDANEVIEGRVAFQADCEDEFSATVERLTQRRVVAFLSANQASPDIACELFFLERVKDPSGTDASGARG